MKQEEHKLQVACINWFRLQYPQYARLLFAIPNGGNRNLITAVRLKQEGVIAGIPDLFFAKPTAKFSGLFIEMKAGKNKPTALQQEQMNILWHSGYKCEVCNGFEQFIQIINEYLKD
jgi:hypothetical protein